MKNYIRAFAGVLLLAAGIGIAQPSRAITPFCDMLFDTTQSWGILISTTFLGPPGTTTGLYCFGDAWNAEVDRQMLEREAVMAIEESTIYSPSFLGGYAQQKGFNSLQEAAQDIVTNGIR